MTDEKIIEAMAMMDGFSWNGKAWEHYGGKTAYILGVGATNYLNSHDAVQRVIDSIPIQNLLPHYFQLLVAVCGFADEDMDMIVRATPRQKCEAILKASGKWEGEE